MIYNFNLGIGWASSGVEYAQAYRAHIFRQLDAPAKFIFTDFISHTNIQHLTANIGFQDDEVVWLYQYFTDIQIAPSSVTLEEVLASLAQEPQRDYREQDKVRYFFGDGNHFITCYLKRGTEDIVERVEYVSDQKLIRKDYYSYTRVFTEYYAPLDGKAHAYLRRFYNEDGSTAYEQILDGEETLYTLGGRIFYSDQEFIAYFVQCLNFQPGDLVIIDRSTGQAEQVLNHLNEAKLAVVIHADHFSQHLLSEEYILWNNYYDYAFVNGRSIDYFIASTQEQANLLQEQFHYYYGYVPRALAIPVGSIDQVQGQDVHRRPYGIMTASRLASEKNIDWIIQAVVQAQKALPDLTLDIYGEGGQRQALQDLVTRLDAEAYIHLKGHQELGPVYPTYPVYISASTSEGFGLTMLEAIGSGCVMIALDVRYGGPAFVADGQSGHLIQREDRSTDQIIEDIAQAIVDIFQGGDLASMRQASYDRSQKYLTDRVRDQWRQLLEEVAHD